jgi:hypothetical protein
MHTRVFTISPQYIVQWGDVPADRQRHEEMSELVGGGGGGVYCQLFKQFVLHVSNTLPCVTGGAHPQLCMKVCGVKESSLPCSRHEGIMGSRGIALLIHNVGTR